MASTNRNVLSATVGREVEREIDQINNRFDDLGHQIELRFNQVDQRFEDFSRQIDVRFEHVSRRIDDLSTNVDQRFDILHRELQGVHGAIHSLERSMIIGLAGAAGSLVAAVVGGVVATVVF